MIDNKNKGLHISNLKGVSRYCNQDKFNIIVCGREKKVLLFVMCIVLKQINLPVLET